MHFADCVGWLVGTADVVRVEGQCLGKLYRDLRFASAVPTPQVDTGCRITCYAGASDELCLSGGEL